MLQRIKYFLAAISAAVIWGFFSIALRNLKGYPAEQILYYRIFTSLLITWVAIILFKKGELQKDFKIYQALSKNERSKLFWFTLLAGAFITGNWFTFIYAVNNVSLKSAAFAYMVCPLLTALGGFLILKEKLSLLKFVGIGIALTSVLILATGSLHEVLWSVFIATLYSGYLIIQRVVRDMDKLTMLGIHLIISTLLMLPLFILHFTTVPLALSFWINILVIAVFFTIIPLFLSLYALSGLPSSTMGIIIYVNPIVAFTVAFFYFREGITTFQACAYGLLLMAVVVFNGDRLMRRSKA